MAFSPEPDPADDRTIQAIAVELSAMQDIARALASIRDPEVRQRVLQWTNERFGTSKPSAGRPSRSEASTSDDSALTFEHLEDLFDNAPASATRDSHAPLDFSDLEMLEFSGGEPVGPESDLSVPAMCGPDGDRIAFVAPAETAADLVALIGTPADLVALAETPADLVALVETPVDLVAAPAPAAAVLCEADAGTAVERAAVPASAPAVARGPQEQPALDSLVKGFARELQRLAVEWQTT